MKILAIDLGQGTQDNLIYDSEKNEENFIKAVFPSPSKDFADRLNRIEGDVFVCGSQIGGGEFSHALVERAKRHRVFITEECAYTIRNDPGEVSDMGLRIVREQPSDFAGTVLHISEPDLDTIGHIMSKFGEGDPEIVAVAVQDHGTYPRGQSNRKERLRRIREKLESDGALGSLLLEGGDVPECYTRMRSAEKKVEKAFPEARVFLMDTAIAAIAGCAVDKEARDRMLAINLGNGHTMCAAIENGMIAGMFEHHTRKLDGEKLGKLVQGFIAHTLTDDEVFSDGGHGCFYLSDFSEPEAIVVTGPNRRIAESSALKFRYAYPAGDTMMSGPAGMISVIREKFY